MQAAFFVVYEYYSKRREILFYFKSNLRSMTTDRVALDDVPPAIF